MKKLLIIALIIFVSFLFSAKNQARAEEWPPLPVIIPIASITLDGNPSDWSNIDTVYIDAEGDDNTDYTGADIKSFKFAQDSDFVYVMADFYDGVPNEELGQAEPYAYQFHFTSVGPTGLPEPIHIDNLGIIYDGVKWNITYLSLETLGVVSGSLTGSSVAVDSVIELKVPKDKLPDTSAFCLQIGTGMGIDGVLGDITEWRILSFLAERILPDKAKELSIEVIGAPYLGDGETWGGKGEDCGVWPQKRFVSSEEIKVAYYYYDARFRQPEDCREGKGLDCSGLSFWSYNRAYFGEEIFTKEEYEERPLYYANAARQYKDNTEIIEKEELRPGDLLFFDTNKNGFMDHVAMYVGGEPYNVIHTSKFTGTITFASYNPNTEELTTRKPTEEPQVLKVTAYGRAIESTVELRFIATSSVDLVVTDPEGFDTSREKPWDGPMEYQVYDINGDGELDDIVVTGKRKIGDYLIEVVPETDALPTDTYTLTVGALVNGEMVTVVLTEDIAISDIPRAPYIIKSTEIEIIPIVSAFIDFNPDTLNLKSRGKYVTTYIELPRGYDINDIDSESIELNSQVPVEIKPIEIGDYDSNGIPDLMVKFNQPAVQNILEVGDEVKLTLTGRLFDGTQFEGTDTIRVIRRGFLAELSILLASLHRAISQLLNLLQNNFFIYD